MSDPEQDPPYSFELDTQGNGNVKVCTRYEARVWLRTRAWYTQLEPSEARAVANAILRAADDAEKVGREEAIRDMQGMEWNGDESRFNPGEMA
jgi:(2Fe-2S) ferredoxin